MDHLIEKLKDEIKEKQKLLRYLEELKEFRELRENNKDLDAKGFEKLLNDYGFPKNMKYKEKSVYELLHHKKLTSKMINNITPELDVYQTRNLKNYLKTNNSGVLGDE